MRSCSCVCTEWNRLVSGSKKLADKRDCLDYLDRIVLKYRLCLDQRKSRVPRSIWPGFNRDEIIASDASKRIQIYNLKTQNLFSPIAKSYKRTIIGITETSLFTYCKSTKNIEIINRDYSTYSDFTLSAKQKGYYRVELTVARNGNIILWNQICVYTFRHNGAFLKKFDYKGLNIWRYTQLKGICCNSKNQIIVLNGNMIQIFDQNGTSLYCVAINPGEKTFCPDEFTRWSKVEDNDRLLLVDSKDHILFLDSVDQVISIFGPNGTLVKQVDCPFKPRSISIINNKIFTSNEDCSITVLGN